jgi:hypothetical protein
MILHDTVILDGARRTRDGYLVGTAKIARTGIQAYRASELGLSDRNPSDVVRIYRPEEEVFAADAMGSFAYKPVTVEHPRDMVTADNWKDHAAGLTGGDIARDGQFIRVPLTLMDGEAIRAYEAGKREFSAGYSCDLVWGEGRTPQGEVYDAKMTTIRDNHVALCERARGGPELRFDHDQPGKGDRTVPTKIITFDGLPVETTDAAEAVINKLKGMLDTSAKAMETALADHKTAVAAKDAELGAKDAQITELKGKVVDAKALDAMVAERSGLISKAKAIAKDLDPTGKSNVELKRAAVVAKLGDDKVKDKSDDYVGALFDHLSADVGQGSGDPVREAVKDGLGGGGASDRDKAYQGYVKSMADAWQMPEKAA